VGIASDSNGFGHVTFKVPEQPIPIITYLPPLAVPLRVHLDAAGLDWLEIADHSQSAAGLTVASSNYLEGGQLGLLRQARCMLNIITPFYPDVAVGLSAPEDYIRNLTQVVRYLEDDIPEGHILVLNFYQTDRSDFTANNSGFGLTPERIEAFNAALAEACQPEGRFGGAPQVTCVDIRPYFESFDDTAYVLKETTRTEFEAALYRSTARTPQIQAYFEENPDGVIMGDGIHLSLAGRDALARQLVDDILRTLRTQYD
jgi:lysophospholipase L1-like esterase